jgi:hypothetical protein
VYVSSVHICRGELPIECFLDGIKKEKITAFLLPSGPDEDPALVPGMHSLYSDGSKIYGQGFLFDDKDEKASPLFTMSRILATNPQLKAFIKPYIGGTEILSKPDHSHHRYAIDLNHIKTEEELLAQDCPSLGPLIEIIRAKVKPYRDSLKMTPVNKPLINKWWRYQAHRPDLYRDIANNSRVIVASKVGTHLAFAFLPGKMIYSQKLIVFTPESYSFWGLLQSSVHREWVSFSGGIMGLGYSYTPSDCFETFPAPIQMLEDDSVFNDGISPALADTAQELYKLRAAILRDRSIGLTSLYALFHDPAVQESDIDMLRHMHSNLDRDVIRCYGWDDLTVDQGFYLNFDAFDEVPDSIDPGEMEAKIFKCLAEARKEPCIEENILHLKWLYGPDFQTRSMLLERLLNLNQKLSSRCSSREEKYDSRKIFNQESSSDVSRPDQGCLFD